MQNKKQKDNTESKVLVIDNAPSRAEQVFDNLDVSENTRIDYKYRIELFLDFVSDNGLTTNTYLDFKRDLVNKTEWGVATKNKYLATARIFLKELNRQGFLPQDITQNIKTFTQSKKHKRDGLNDTEMSLLVESIGKLPETPCNSRLRAIVGLLALQGLRQIEIVRLDVKDIDFVSNTCLIQGKGRDDKEAIYLQPETAKALSNYIKSNRVKDGALFVSNSNNSKNQRLTTRALRGLVKQTLTDLNIDKTTHGFRHYFTTKLIKAYKGDLLEVAGYTRHKSLEMLTVYNDNIKKKADLPRFYKTFEGVTVT